MKLRSAAIFVTLAAAMSRAAPAPGSSCLECHDEQGAPFHASVHSALGCTACHTGIKGFPHPDPVAKVNCGSCHSGVAAALASSKHAGAGQQSCATCHGDVHAIVPVKDTRSPVYPLNLPRTCGACHGNKKFAREHGLPDVYSEYMDSIHGFALTKDGLLVAATCSSCHGAHDILDPRNPRSRTSRANIPATCGACHQGIERKYLRRDSRQSASGRRRPRAGLHQLPHRAPDRQRARGGLPDEDHGDLRKLPPGEVQNLPRYLPRPGVGAGLRRDGALLGLPWRARHSSQVRLQVSGGAGEPGANLRQVPRRRQRQLRDLFAARGFS